MEVNYFTILYWFCHTSTLNLPQVYTCSPFWTPSLLPPCTIPLGRLSAPAPIIQYHALNLDWRFIPYMTLYMFPCHSPKSSHLLPLPQSPKDCSIHLCLFCCLAYRVVITIFYFFLTIYHNDNIHIFKTEIKGTIIIFTTKGRMYIKVTIEKAREFQ